MRLSEALARLRCSTAITPAYVREVGRAPSQEALHRAHTLTTKAEQCLYRYCLALCACGGGGTLYRLPKHPGPHVLGGTTA